VMVSREGNCQVLPFSNRLQAAVLSNAAAEGAAAVCCPIAWGCTLFVRPSSNSNSTSYVQHCSTAGACTCCAGPCTIQGTNHTQSWGVVSSQCSFFGDAGDADYVVPFTGSRAWVYDMGMSQSKPWHTWTLQGDDQVCVDLVHTACCDSCQLQPPYCQVLSPEAGVGVWLAALLVTVWGLSWHAVVNPLLDRRLTHTQLVLCFSQSAQTVVSCSVHSFDYSPVSCFAVPCR
jgi:hypothetical protein